MTRPRPLLAAALLLLAAPARAAECPEPAVTGVQPCDDVLKPAMILAGSGLLGSAGWPIKTMHAGLGENRRVVPGRVPCVLLSAVATTESNWKQFGYVACGQSAPTLVSFDCGYGIGQITSGMNGTGGFSPSRVAAEPLYNLSVSANILISKWEYTAAVEPNEPMIAEDWYFALWGYNGLATKNNPNTHPNTVGTYYNPDNPAYPRNEYAYQEVVLGYALYPRKGSDGQPRWPSTRITHINFAEICSACGNPGSSLVVSRPSPEHSGDCTATGPEWGAQFVAQSFPAASKGVVTLRPGETTPAYIELRNVGTRAWDGNTRLATTVPRDRASLFAASDWLAPHRPAAVQGSVAPGQTYRFDFSFRAPDAPGTYDEFFGVVQEGVAWFSDPDQGGPPDGQLQARLVVLEPDDAGLSGPDAGSPSDAATDAALGSDAAGLADAGNPSLPEDASAPGGDAATALDAGDSSADATFLAPIEVSAGCGCAGAGAGPLWPALAGLLLAAGIRRRKAAM